MLRNKSMVVGSTGLVGKSVVNHLIERGIAVLALVRNDAESDNSLLNYYKIDKLHRSSFECSLIKKFLSKYKEFVKILNEVSPELHKEVINSLNIYCVSKFNPIITKGKNLLK